MAGRKRKYRIGITFTGTYRDKYVEPFAKELLHLGFSEDDIFYDSWHDDVINGPRGGDVLRDIYHNQCACVVVLLSPDYKEKNWTYGIEWRAVLELINTGEAKRICLLGVDSVDIGQIDGLYKFQTIVKNIDNMNPREIACFIAKKYSMLNPRFKFIKNNKQKKINSKAPDSEEREMLYGFTNKLHRLYNKDGMMRCLYELFQQHIDDNAFSLSDLSVLSIVQDEYEKEYNQDQCYKEVKDTAGLDRILEDESVIQMENDPQTHPLIITYMHFVRADRMYFMKDYDGAIQHYQEADKKIKGQYKGTELSDIDKERCAYLQNAIAWSYRLRRRPGDNSIAIDIYRKLFDDYPDINNHSFSCKYRRNYGVCLEIAEKFIEAIDQYEKAIDNYSEADNNGNLSEFKLFITYCSAMMKYWDKKTGKTSGQWIDNTRDLFKDEEDYLSDESMTKIDARLDYAEKIIIKHNQTQELFNVYNQRSKLLTYKMMIASEKVERDRYIHDIIANLTRLQDLCGKKNSGWKFIKRDFFYARYEVSEDKKAGEKHLQTAWNTNEELEGKGDSIEFRGMLERKMNELH